MTDRSSQHRSEHVAASRAADHTADQPASRQSGGIAGEAPSAALSARVREAWEEACRQHDAELPALNAAVTALARDARARGVDVAAVLRTLDTVILPDRGGDRRLDFDHVREIAGSRAIRAYYRDD